jgi:hypothetical protein
MAHEYTPLTKLDHLMICCQSKLENHLIYFCITVSAYGTGVMPFGIHDFDHFFRSVVFRQIIPGSMVENVSKAEDPAAVMMIKSIDHALGTAQGTMDI